MSDKDKPTGKDGDSKAADEKMDDAVKKKPKKSSGGRLLLMLVSIVVVAFVIAVYGAEYFGQRQTADNAGGETAGSGPTVGGPFELVDHTGRTVTDKDFRGRYMMVFFGYTYCPDVCPTALSDIAAALDMLPPEKAEKVTPVFISVDPARDTPEHLAEYVSFFHPRTVGLTGTEEQIREAARAYRVFYRLNKPSGDDLQDYLVDHTSIIYLVGPEGQLVTHFTHGTTVEAMAERLGQLL